MASEYGLTKLERIYQQKIAPATVKVLMKVYGVKVDIYRIKNKKSSRSLSSISQSSNKYSREVYQNSSLLANEIDQYSIIDSNETDYLDNLDVVESKYVLLTTQTFESFNGFVAGLSEEMNMYCLSYDFMPNDVIQVTTKEGISKRYKVLRVEAIGDTVVVLKRYIVISLSI